MMKTLVSAFLVICVSLTVMAQNKPEPGGEKPKDPAYAKVVDDPKLPRVLLIGDSISVGYTPAVQQLLKGKANVHRIPTNGGPTSNGVKNIDKWLEAGKFDVIHFNFGLHDLKRMEPDNKQQVGLADYEKNLREIVTKMQKSGAKLIWCNTTPVPEGKTSPPRVPADVVAYNEVAAKVMAEHKIPTDDLYAFALPRLKEIQRPVNVHFTPEGSKLLGEQVAKAIEAALSK